MTVFPTLIRCTSSPYGRCQFGCHELGVMFRLNMATALAARRVQLKILRCQRHEGIFKKRCEALNTWQHRIGIKTADIRIDRPEMVKAISTLRRLEEELASLDLLLGSVGSPDRAAW